MTIINWQLSCDMLIERVVLSSKMPKDGSLSGNTKGTAVPSSRYLCVHLPNLFGTQITEKNIICCIL